uniref:Uncharacterized protein n=1 Tax=Avena sativa TaxID=4498 RepID=A0ACD5XHE8_AVESA
MLFAHSQLLTINTTLEAQDKFHALEIKTSSSHLWIPATYPVASLRQHLGHLLRKEMKMSKAPQLLKKAAAMCKSKTGLLAGRLLVLAALQRRRMSSVVVISHKIHALVVADRESVDCHKSLIMMSKVENRQVAVHGVDMAAGLSYKLALFDQESRHGGCPDWTLHPIFSDDDKCYTDEYEVDDHACDADDENEPSVMDVIRSNRKIEGLEFNMEDEIDQAADLFIRRFRQQLNKSL